MKAPNLELKPLPSTLRYTFFHSQSNFPFIVNSSLPNDEVNDLCDMLNRHKGMIGYSINDLKGLSTTICIHIILLKDDAKPTIEAQRMLNPTLKEVIKLPIQVVPKKGDLTIVQNERNDLVPTRTITG